MKKPNTNLILIAGGAAVAAWWLFFRKSGSAGQGGGGSGSGSVPSGGAPATSFTSNVRPGGGTVVQPGKGMQSGLQSAMALTGDIGGLVKGIGKIGKDVWNAFTGLFGGSGPSGPVDDWGNSVATDAEWTAPYADGILSPDFGNYTPTNSATTFGRDFGVGDSYGGGSAMNWGTPDNIVNSTNWENTVPYYDAPGYGVPEFNTTPITTQADADYYWGAF